MAYTYKYPRPALTVDCVVFGLDEDALKVLLIRRDHEPFRDMWALPGGFVNIDETLEAAALRELEEETGMSRLFMEQLYTFGALDRDPRERVVTVAYYVLVNLRDHRIRAGSDARAAAWFPLTDLPDLAFDHADVLKVARRRLQGKLSYEPIGFELLPGKFTLSELQRLYEVILERPLDKRNFRRKILRTGLLVELGEKKKAPSGRPARLYCFDRKKYKRMKETGFMFQL